MHPPRAVRTVDAMPASYRETGHFWLQEYVTGRVLRFVMDPSGLLHFGDHTEPFGDRTIPPQYRAGVKAVREQLDRDVLRDRTEDVGSYSFVGVVPLAGGVAYVWDEIPAFLGFDIWDGGTETFVPEDVTERVFQTVGLEPLPAFRKEVPARSFDPESYDIPTSHWSKEQAAGVLLRKKNGDPAVHLRPDIGGGHWSDDEAVNSTEQDRSERGPDAFESWLEAELTIDALATLHGAAAASLWERSIEELVDTTTNELARRTFDEFGSLAERAPEHFESLVRERIATLSGERSRPRSGDQSG